MTRNEISDATVIDLARIITDLNRDVADLRQSIDAQVRTHPLYREQVRRTQDAQRHAADQRAEIARLHAEREERTGPVAEEPTDLGAVIVTQVRDVVPRPRLAVAVGCDGARDRAWWVHGLGLVAWSDLTAPRWATAKERATGKVDPEQDEAETEPTDWEPGADVTDRLAEAPESVIVQDRDGDYWRHTGGAGWRLRLKVHADWSSGLEDTATVANLAPVTVATTEQLRAAGILTGSDQPQDEEEN